MPDVNVLSVSLLLSDYNGDWSVIVSPDAFQEAQVYFRLLERVETPQKKQT